MGTENTEVKKIGFTIPKELVIGELYYDWFYKVIKIITQQHDGYWCKPLGSDPDPKLFSCEKSLTKLLDREGFLCLSVVGDKGHINIGDKYYNYVTEFVSTCEDEEEVWMINNNIYCFRVLTVPKGVVVMLIEKHIKTLDAKIEVTIQTFKDTGKWNCEYKFETDIPVYDGPELIKEAIKRFSLSDQDFTIKATQNTKDEYASNFRLVKRTGYNED